MTLFHGLADGGDFWRHSVGTHATTEIGMDKVYRM